MSRSFRKTPVTSMTGARSEKSDKKIWHRRFRRASNMLLNTLSDNIEKAETSLFPNILDVSNVWSFSKDGKHYNTQEPFRLSFNSLSVRLNGRKNIRVETRRGFRRFLTVFRWTKSPREVYHFWGK